MTCRSHELDRCCPFELFPIMCSRLSLDKHDSPRHMASHVSSAASAALTWSHLSSCPALLRWLRWAYKTGVYPGPLCLCSLSCRPWSFVLWGYITPGRTVETHMQTHMQHCYCVHMPLAYFNTLLIALWLTILITCVRNSFSSCWMIHWSLWW